MTENNNILNVGRDLEDQIRRLQNHFCTPTALNDCLAVFVSFWHGNGWPLPICCVMGVAFWSTVRYEQERLLVHRLSVLGSFC